MMFIMLDRAKPPTPVQLANARKRRPCPGSRGHWPKSSQRARSWVTSEQRASAMGGRALRVLIRLLHVPEPFHHVKCIHNILGQVTEPSFIPVDDFLGALAWRLLMDEQVCNQKKKNGLAYP